ncbi:DUF6602 domain-containing protein [Sorangium sp. So ce295]|uniref:DUF6602 domain-containing protein n=1 Tax=Sorangium sp. So ce295 TaxID=3133295 RepID=UPI003F5FE031
MPISRQKTKPDIEGLAGRYAEELDAQFRTLNFFTKHPGEVGRTHEAFIMNVLSRYLPSRLRCGTGFIVSESGVSRQQDIIIFDHAKLPTLYDAGGVVAVDANAVAAAIEVKTCLDEEKTFVESLASLSELRTALRLDATCFVGLYAYEGPSTELAVECLRRVAESVDVANGRIPDAVYVRGKYVLAPNRLGNRWADAQLIRLDIAEHGDGTGLLSMLTWMWFSIQSHGFLWPWWLHAWSNSMWDRCEGVAWSTPAHPEPSKRGRLRAGGEARVTKSRRRS